MKKIFFFKHSRRSFQLEEPMHKSYAKSNLQGNYGILQSLQNYYNKTKLLNCLKSSCVCRYTNSCVLCLHTPKH